jgi:putative aldouronate transport system substrate-binding protein
MSLRRNTLFKSTTITLSFALVVTACSTAAPISEKKSVDQGGTADKKYTYTFAGFQFVPVDKDAEIVKYWNDKYNVDLKALDIDSSKYNEILNLKFASGETPDVLKADFNNFQKYVSQDLMAEIPLEVLKKNAPTIYSKTVEASPNAFALSTINGKIYGIPLLSFHSEYRNATVFRGDWMKNVGVEKTPETLDEFEKLMYKFSNEDPDKNGQKDTFGLSADGLLAVYGAYGRIPSQWSEKDGKLVYGAIQPEMKEALGKLNQWFKDKVIDPEFLTGESQGGNTSVSTSFAQGRIGFTTKGVYYQWKPLLYDGDSASDNYLELKKLNAAAADALMFGIPPKGPTGKSGVPQGNFATGTIVGFGKQLEKDPAKLAKLLQVLDGMNSSYDQFLTSFFGIKGKHWDFNKENVPVQINGFKTNDLSKIGAHIVFNMTELPQYQKERSGPRVVWADKNRWKEGGIRNKLEASLPSASRFSAELEKMEKEAYISIITGNKPLSHFDEFAEKWKKSGGEQLEKEANDWYKTFK